MKKCFFLGIWVLGLLLSSLIAEAAGNPALGAVEQSQKVRAWHFVLRAVPLDRAYWMVDQAHTAGFNTVVVTVTDGVNLQNAPWKTLSAAWSREEFEKWVAYARDKGMEVIPEIKLLTHQEKLFQNNRPLLMFNRSTYDPRNKAVYAQVTLLMDKIVEITHAHALHIGHDEVAGYNPRSAKKWLNEGEKMLPAYLFLQDVLKLHGYLKQRGIETWMWGDMLISPDEFPDMNPKSFHGGVAGYGKALRDKLPKDIVICDWHYADDQADFPSLAAFRQEGFRVLGSTWKMPKTIRNFSHYAAAHGAYGMIATTWFHVQRKEWDVVERIINESGVTFRKDFPDGK